jgi:Rod binding domain-containing protein
MSLSMMPWVSSNKSNMQSAINARLGPTPMTAHDKLVQQAKKWVAMTFFDPMFKQMREDPFHSDLLDGGRGGQAFYAMYDQALSERMSGPASNGLVQAIVSRIEARRAYGQQMKFKPSSEREGADRIPPGPASDIFARGSYGDLHVTSTR